MVVSYFLLLSSLSLSITVQAQDCSVPTPGPNMTLNFDPNQSFTSGTTVTFTCDPGYVGAGSAAITCTAGNWTPVRLKCERFNCGPIGELQNGNVDYPQGTLFGDKVVITCNPGFIMVGKSHIFCGSKGWLDRLPVCEVIHCSPPHPVENGIFNPKEEIYEYLNVIRYDCQPGFTLNGSKALTCSENATFQPAPPNCVKVNCEEPVVPNAKIIDGSRPPHGHLASVVLQCNPGFTMFGESSQTCEINSKWSPGLPVCNAITTTTTTTTPPTTTTTTTTTTTKKPTDGTEPGNDGNKLPMALGITFAVLLVFVGCGCYFFGVPAFIRKKRGSRKGYPETTKDEEGVALS